MRWLMGSVVLSAVVCSGAQPTSVGIPGFEEADPAMTRLFTPAGAPAGIYGAHRLPEAIDTVELHLRQLAGSPPTEGWAVEALAPLDAFGSDTPYDRARLARLYGGSRPRVARGWLALDGCRASVTLVSPYPDVTLSRLEPGTLAVIYRVARHLQGC